MRTAAGERFHLPREAYEIEVLDRWRSPASDALYPALWNIRVPSLDIELRVKPLLADQELRTSGTTGVTYWEGFSEFRGRIGGREVDGRGYIELVGYAGRFNGI